MIKNTLKDFIDFVIYPNDNQINISLKSKLSLFIIMFFLYCLLIIIFLIPLLELIYEISKLSGNTNVYLTLPTTIFFFVFLIPFIEELIFRYFLRFNGIKTMMIGHKKWLEIFPKLVYGSSICFGFLHLTNFSNPTYIFFLLSPLIILPQIIIGFFISYLRVRLNFLWGVFFHCLWNFMALIVIPYINYSLADAHIEKAINHTIIIESQLFFNEEKQALKIDSINGKVKNVNATHYSLQQIVDTLYKKDTFIIDDELINLKFESKNGLTKLEFRKILEKIFLIR